MMTAVDAACWKIAAVINFRVREAREEISLNAHIAQDDIDFRALFYLSPLSGSVWVDPRPLIKTQLDIWRFSRGW